MNTEKKTKHNLYLEFEHKLRYLFYDLQNITQEDLFLLDDIKHSIIIYLMRKDYEETNEVFLHNMKDDFYSAINTLENNHSQLGNELKTIKDFMEKYYFNA